MADSADPARYMEMTEGAVDLYVHARPDLLPRRSDDLGLALDLAAAGYRAAVHRHHFGSTVERTALAAAATGFDLLGGVLLNDSVGGLNPYAAELALRLGGRWIGLPTLSAAFHRRHLPAVSENLRGPLEFGPGQLSVLDAEGTLTEPARDVLEVAHAGGAVLNLGYVSPAECAALVDAAPDGRRLVMTNPHTTMRQTAQEVDELASRGVMVEVTAYALHPAGPTKKDVGKALDAVSSLLRRVGVDHCLLSSDGGMEGAPPPHELLGWMLRELSQRGFAPAELRRLTTDNPRELLQL